MLTSLAFLLHSCLMKAEAMEPPPPPPPPKTRIEPVKEKAEHKFHSPNILRIDHVYKPTSINLEKVKPLELRPI